MKNLKIDLLKEKLKSLFSMKYSKLVVSLVLVAIIATVVFTNKTIRNKIFGSKTKVTQRTATVKKGDLQVVVSGSGPISFTNDKILYSKINATVTKVNYKEGDTVKAGDVIAEFDDADFQSTLDTTRNNIQQNQVAAETSNEAVSNLNIRAPFSGQVSNITANVGDNVQAGGTVLTINDTSKLKVSLTFNAADAAYIRAGETANVNISSLMQSVSGTVTYVSNQSIGTTSGGKVYTVDIQMNNPGALVGGMTASADVETSAGEVSSTNTAALSYASSQAVISKTGGTVQSIYVKENQKVSSGSTLVVMKNNDVVRAKESADLKIAGSQTQLDSSSRQLDYYKIVAPFDGTITKLAFKVGDTVKPGDVVADVADPTQMQFDIPVDELDVAKLSVGQKVNISVDSLPDTSTTPIAGEVSKIAVSGTATSGVTTFPVTIKIDDNLDKLKGGMNANADIVVSDEQNVLYVPIEAVTTVGTKNYVWVKGSGTGSGSTSGSSGSAFNRGSSNGTNSKSSSNNSSNNNGGNNGNESSASNNEATVSTKIGSGSSKSGYTGKTAANSYYANAVRKEVEVGSNSDTYIEIKSGLSQGDVVILPQTQTTSTKTSTSSTRGGGQGGPGGGF